MSETADPQNLRSGVARRLAAVAFADVAGYSRLMAAHDMETVNVWRKLRTEIMQPHMMRHGGRLAETAGDAILIEFSSAVSAVSWAVDVQRTIRSLQQHETEPRVPSLQLRIGINIDDIIDDNGILQGTGINVASRIHQAAEPGQIAVTSAVCDCVMNRLSASFRDLGMPPMKNIDRPIRVFLVEWDREASPTGVIQPYLEWSTRPTLAVLPFRNISGVDADEYFGEGITEDIITGLSRSRSLYVIARTSTLRYRDRKKDTREIAGELGVRYVLDGSVRRRQSSLRINTELIDVLNNRTIWAERFDGALDDLFDFQDRIATSIVSSLEPHVQAVETARIGNRPTESLDAYDCVLKAMSKLYLFTKDSFRETEALLERATSLDPSYAQAYTYLAWRLNFWIGEGHSLDLDADRARALWASRRSIELDPSDSFGLAVAGHVLAFIDRRPGDAVSLFEQALRLNQNSAFSWAMSALTAAYLGRADEAMERLQNVWRISPFDPLNFYFWIVAGIAAFVAERYEDAIAWLRKSRLANPRFVPPLRMLAASLALSGDEAGARKVAEELLAIEPTFRISSFVSWYPLQLDRDLARLEDGLRRAGLPP